jgi:hypothetical protein
MTQPILRVLIQNNFAIGRLPHTHIPRIWGGPRGGKGLVRGLTLAAFAAIGTMTCVASAGAATRIESCTTLSTIGETYVLTGNPVLTSCGTCLVVANDRITVDLAGRTIDGSCDGTGVGGDGITDGGTGRQGTTVKNGTITGFEVGVSLGSSTRNQILNVTSSANSAIGIIVGVRSLVKGCVVRDNGGYGILIDEFGQVQDCTIAGHVGGFGISGAGHLLVKDNDVEGNGVGIVIGDFGNVSFNTSSGNTASGLFAGDHSLVTGNTTNGNGLSGITTGGLSSVSYNTSSDNGGGGINVVVFDGSLDDGTRNLVTGNTTNDNGEVGVTAMCPGTVTNNKSSGNAANYDISGPGCRTTNNK